MAVIAEEVAGFMRAIAKAYEGTVDATSDPASRHGVRVLDQALGDERGAEVVEDGLPILAK